MMKLILLSIGATSLLASPSIVDAWVCGPGLYSFSNPMVMPSTEEMLRRRNEMMRRKQIMADGVGFSRSSPRYEIKDTLDKFQVAMDVPGVPLENIDIAVENDGTVLSISGLRESMDESTTFSSKFNKRFSLDPTIDVEQFSATLQNGVLIVSAPKDLMRIKDSIRKIPIQAITHSASIEIQKEDSGSSEEEGHGGTEKDTPLEKDDGETEHPPEN